MKILQSLLYINVHLPLNQFMNPFTVQSDLLIALSLRHSSADNKQVAFVVCI